MSSTVTKVAPQAVVLAVAVYWIWPNVVGGDPKAETKPPASSREFTAAMLTPAFPPPPKRDPFLPPGADSGVAARPAPAGPKAAGGKNVNAKTANKKDDAKPAELVLNATCIAGEQRLAIINGRIYKPQDRIGASDAKDSQYVVAEIMPDKVLLEHQGRSVPLCYLNAVAGNSAGSPARSGAMAGASWKSRSKKSSVPSKSSGGKSTAKAKQ